MKNEKVLTIAELDIISLVVKGFRNKEIAYQRKVSEKTIKNQLSRIYLKTDCRGRTDLVVKFVSLASDYDRS